MNYFKIIITVLSLSLFSCQGQKSNKVELLDAKTFSEKLNTNDQIQILDVRTPGEYEDQHIDKATNIDWNGADFEKKVILLDKKKPIYVYCKSGGRSAKATRKLAEMGYTKIYELDGGMMKWNAAGLSKPDNASSGMTQDSFNKLLISDKKVLIDIYAEWCEPCQKMAPYLDKMTAEMAEKVTIIRIDADKNKALVEQLKIDILPTLLLYENKEVKWRTEGFISEEDLTKKL
jgi:thioredoxin